MRKFINQLLAVLLACAMQANWEWIKSSLGYIAEQLSKAVFTVSQAMISQPLPTGAQLRLHAATAAVITTELVVCLQAAIVLPLFLWLTTIMLLSAGNACIQISVSYLSCQPQQLTGVYKAAFAV